MSNIIPPLVSSSPPPMVAGELDDLEDDEFGDFTAAADLSSFEGYSLPTTPQHGPLSNFATRNTNFIMSPSGNQLKTKQHVNGAEEVSCNGQLDDHNIEPLTNDSSENIFCDIKSDVNNDLSEHEPSFVNNNKLIEIHDDITIKTRAIIITPSVSVCVQNSENTNSKLMPTVETETIILNQKEVSKDYDYCDKRKDLSSCTELQDKDTSNVEASINILLKTKETINDEEQIEKNDCFSEKIDATEETTVFNEFSDTVKEEIENVLIVSEVNGEENRIIANEKDIHDKNNSLESFEDFGSFSTMPETEFSKETIVDSLDDFGDFSSISQSTKEDEFGDFSTTIITQQVTNKIDEFYREPIEDLDDFQDFSTAVAEALESDLRPLELESTESSNDDGDDFGDFNDFETADLKFVANFEAPSTIETKNADEVIKKAFICPEAEKDNCYTIDFISNDLFRNIHDIENTNALSYHWSNSESQKMMLKALNIDSRNILYGPRWNASMPRFAANLGFAPLEPMKSELGPILPTQPGNISPTEQPSCEVPAAKFDWNGSGLTNPLDYSPANTMLLNLEQLVPSLDIPNVSLTSCSSQNNPAPLPLDLDSWDYWLQTPSSQPSVAKHLTATGEDKPSSVLPQQQTEVARQHPPYPISSIPVDLNILNNFGSDTESVNSLKFIENSAEVETEYNNQGMHEKEDDFTSFQSSTVLPLRETHISSVLGLNLETFDLKSTIVTPDLPRKTIVNTVETIELTIEKESEPGPVDDDFTDFQMSLPPPKTEFVPLEPLKKPLEPLKPIVLGTATNVSTKINWPEPGIVTGDLNEFDFSNFTSVNSPPIIIDPSAAPDCSITNHIIIKETKINEIDPPTCFPAFPTLSNIKQTHLNEIDAPKNPVNHLQKQESLPAEEDDWSDFVSATNSPKNNQTKSNNKAGQVFQNPDAHLQLSVPNLQNTQLSRQTALPPAFMPNLSPTKTLNQPSTQQLAAKQVSFDYQPPYQIPLQTINTPFGGLPQTSLAATYNFTIGPTELTNNAGDTQTQKRQQPFGIFDGPFHNELKPFQSGGASCRSLSTVEHISSSENYHKMNATSAGYQLHSVENMFLQMQPPANNKAGLNGDEDDDWTDFVSSNEPVPATNGFPKSPVNWGNNTATPNIIANPVHFETFQSYQGPAHDVAKKKKEKTSVPSISALPELDFIAPKNKFFPKK